MQGQIEAQDGEVKKIEARLRENRSEVERLQKIVKEQKEQTKSREQQWQAEKKAHGQVKSQAETVAQRCADLETLLKVSDAKVRYIDELAVPLTEDQAVDVSVLVCIHANGLGKLTSRAGRETSARSGSNASNLRKPVSEKITLSSS